MMMLGAFPQLEQVKGVQRGMFEDGESLFKWFKMSDVEYSRNRGLFTLLY